MKNSKAIISLFFAMLSCFTLGLYAASEFKFGIPIEPYRWIMTILLGLGFFGYFLGEIDKNK
jgi:hypothetical protein